MLKKLKALFDEHIGSMVEEPEILHAMELAAAALLVEISRADHEIADEERTAITAAMNAAFDLEPTEIEDLIDTAGDAVEHSVSLYDFTSIINDKFSRKDKIRLVEMLWQVAFADSRLDHYEEYYIRKVADLLHVSHKEYIAAKLRADPKS